MASSGATLVHTVADTIATAVQAKTTWALVLEGILKHYINNYMGNKYSKEDLERHTKLCNLYSRHLNLQSPPILFKLQDDKPQRFFNVTNYIDFIDESLSKYQNAMNFHNEIKLIAYAAARFLKYRQSRFMGIKSGFPGDIVEMFFGEWIEEFALKELLTYEFNDRTKENLLERLNLMEQVIKSDIFQHTKIPLHHKEHNILSTIATQLQACIKKVDRKAFDISANHQLKCISNNLGAGISDCADVLYYARNSNLDNQDLDIGLFLSIIDNTLDPDIHIPKERITIYKEIFKSYTGEMLYSLIKRIGTIAFNSEGEVNNLNPQPEYASHYFNAKGSCLPIDFKNYVRKFDSFHWIKEGEEQIKLTNLLQQFTHGILRLAMLQPLIVYAITITQLEGDIWAYGDQEGRTLLTALLDLIESEVQHLWETFDREFYVPTNKIHLKFDLENKINSTKKSNPNSTIVDATREKIDQFKKRITDNISTIRILMGRFPINSKDQVEKNKLNLSKDIQMFMLTFCPDKINSYNFKQIDIQELIIQYDIIKKEDPVNSQVNLTTASIYSKLNINFKKRAADLPDPNNILYNLLNDDELTTPSKDLWKYSRRGCIEYVIKSNIIKDYKKLYITLNRICYDCHKDFDVWAFYIASGEVDAIRYLKFHADECKYRYSEGSAYDHMAAATGLVDLFKIRLFSTKLYNNHDGFNQLHYAVNSGSLDLLDYLIKSNRRDERSLDQQATTYIGATLAHFAALSGSVEMILYCCHGLKFHFNRLTGAGQNMLHFAAKSGSVEAIYLIRKLYYINNIMLNANTTDLYGKNAFWYANKSHNVIMANEALIEPMVNILNYKFNTPNVFIDSDQEVYLKRAYQSTSTNRGIELELMPNDVPTSKAGRLYTRLQPFSFVSR